MGLSRRRLSTLSTSVAGSRPGRWRRVRRCLGDQRPGLGGELKSGAYIVIDRERQKCPRYDKDLVFGYGDLLQASPPSTCSSTAAEKKREEEEKSQEV